jgi:hypothetical protein
MCSNQTTTGLYATDAGHTNVHQDQIRAFDGETSKDFLTATSGSNTLNPRNCSHGTPNRFASQWRVIANKYGGHSEYTSSRLGTARIAAAASDEDFGTHSGELEPRWVT